MTYRILLAAALAATALGACKGDDEPDADLTAEELLQAYVWQVSAFVEEGIETEVAADDCRRDDSLDFREDGTLVIDYNSDRDCGGAADETPLEATYIFTQEGGLETLRISYVDGDNTFSYTETILLITEDELRLGDEDESTVYRPL